MSRFLAVLSPEKTIRQQAGDNAQASSPFASLRGISALPALLVAVVVGLYTARLLAEVSGRLFDLPVLTLGAVLSVAVIYLVCRLRNWPSGSPLPGLVLGVYIFWPNYAPGVGLAVGAVAVLALLFARYVPAFRFPYWGWDLPILGLALLAYMSTLAPGVLPADSGEFQYVTALLGVAHPPGYPLYTLIGHLFTLLPIHDPAWRVNLFSAVTAAATVTLVSAIVRRLSGSGWGGLVAALTLGAGTTFWNVATTASIRPLTGLFAALGVYAIVGFATAHPTGRRDRYLVLFALAFGLGLGHHPSLVFVGLCAILTVLLLDPSLIRQPRRWLWPTVAFIVSFLPLVYLPIRGAAGAIGAPAGLNTPSGFLDHVLARGFSGDLFSFTSLNVLLTRLQVMVDILRYEFNDPLLLAAGVGAILLARRTPQLLVLLVGGAIVHTAVTATYRAPQTAEYLLPTYVLLAVLVGYTVGALPELARSRYALMVAGRWIAAAILLAGVAVAVQNVSNASWLLAGGGMDTGRYVEQVLGGAPPRAIILANWHWYTPMRYAQLVEGQRPDAEVQYVYPNGAEPLAATWVRRIGESLAQGRPVVVTMDFPSEYQASAYRFEPLAEALLVRQTPRREPPAGLANVDRMVGNWRLVGYRLVTDTVRAGDDFSVEVAWQALSAPSQDTAFFVHLLGSDGIPLGQFDLRHPASRVEAGEILVDRYPLAVPPGLPSGEYRLVAGAYIVGPDGKPNRLKGADGADLLPLGAMTVRPADFSAVTRHPFVAGFQDSPTLLGADHDFTLAGVQRVFLHWQGEAGAQARTIQLWRDGSTVGTASLLALPAGDHETIAINLPPSPAVPSVRLLDGEGRPVLRRAAWGLATDALLPLAQPEPGDRYVPLGGGITFVGVDSAGNPGSGVIGYTLRFLARHPLLRDRTVSLRLQAPGWPEPLQNDTIPELGALPTLKWVWGTEIPDRHVFAMPSQAATGPIQGQMILYDAFTQKPLPILDPRLAQLGQSVPIRP